MCHWAQTMDYLVEIVLIGLQFPVWIGLIYWFLRRLQNETSGQERIRVRFGDLSRRRKLFGILLLGYMVFTLYVIVAGVLSLTGTTGFPLAGVSSTVTLWMLAIGLVGLAYTMSTAPTRSSKGRLADKR